MSAGRSLPVAAADADFDESLSRAVQEKVRVAQRRQRAQPQRVKQLQKKIRRLVSHQPASPSRQDTIVVSVVVADRFVRRLLKEVASELSSQSQLAHSSPARSPEQSA